MCLWRTAGVKVHCCTHLLELLVLCSSVSPLCLAALRPKNAKLRPRTRFRFGWAPPSITSRPSNPAVNTMPTYSHMAVVLRDIILLSCISAAAAQDEWGQLKQQIRYPTAMRKAMEDCACTGSTQSWHNRRSKLKDWEARAKERPRLAEAGLARRPCTCVWFGFVQ